MYGGYEISRRHAIMLAQASGHDADDQAKREATAEAWSYRCAALAGPYHEAVELQRAAHAAEEARAERAAEQERQARIAAAEDYKQMLLATGQGRLRTVEEVLASMRGWG